MMYFGYLEFDKLDMRLMRYLKFQPANLLFAQCNGYVEGRGNQGLKLI